MADQPQSQVNTQGGAAVGGNVDTQGGIFVGGNHITINVQNVADAEKATDVIRRGERVQGGGEPKPYEPEIVPVPAGSFVMGFTGDDVPKEWQAHAVELPVYHIGKTPVTNLQYAEFVRVHREHSPKKSGWRNITPPDGQNDQPVTGVTWEDALAYCDWLTGQTERRYRLPSEAEWEKAARLGVIRGGVREWTSTIWGDDTEKARFVYPYRNDGRDALIAPKVYRIVRGASGDPLAQVSASTGRGLASPKTQLNDIGFRVVLEGA